MRPLLFLARFRDVEIQRYAALALAGLAIGDKGNNKIRIVEEGAVRPVVDLARFPDVEIQRSAAMPFGYDPTLKERCSAYYKMLSERGMYLRPWTSASGASSVMVVRQATSRSLDVPRFWALALRGGRGRALELERNADGDGLPAVDCARGAARPSVDARGGHLLVWHPALRGHVEEVTVRGPRAARARHGRDHAADGTAEPHAR